MNSEIHNRTVWADREASGNGPMEFSGSKDLAQEHLMVALVVLSSLCLVGFILCATAAALTTYKKFFRAQKCHICAEKIRLWHWNDGSHRAFCYAQNVDFLKSLPEPFDVRCPKCTGKLKLMPKVSDA